jgi:phosphoglycolate phosphatase
MSQKFTILFDLDGTIIETAGDLMAAHNHVMKKFGHKEKKLNDIKKLAGKGAWVMMQRSFKEEIKDKELKKKMTEEFLDYYSKNINKESKPKEGLINFLDWAKSINISLSICTNKQEALSKDLIKKLNLSKYFDFIAGSDTFDFNKPDPRHLTNVIEIVGGEKTKSIMIGDSEVDAEASYNAQLPFVLVEDGYTEKNINEIRHDFKIKNFHFLKEIVEKLI